jgi:hypothetical protein
MFSGILSWSGTRYRKHAYFPRPVFSAPAPKTLAVYANGVISFQARSRFQFLGPALVKIMKPPAVVTASHPGYANFGLGPILVHRAPKQRRHYAGGISLVISAHTSGSAPPVAHMPPWLFTGNSTTLGAL